MKSFGHYSLAFAPTSSPPKKPVGAVPLLP